MQNIPPPPSFRARPYPGAKAKIIGGATMPSPNVGRKCVVLFEIDQQNANGMHHTWDHIWRCRSVDGQGFPDVNGGNNPQANFAEEWLEILQDDEPDSDLRVAEKELDKPITSE